MANPSLILQIKTLIHQSLKEDGAEFDWSARALGTSDQTQSAILISKSDGIFSGSDVAQAVQIVAHETGADLALTPSPGIIDGARLSRGQEVLRLQGSGQSVVVFERTLINLLSYTSGIATQTRTCVAELEKSYQKKYGTTDGAPRITPTRKTLPGYRALAIQAALHGGAHPHRVALSGGILLKENHIAQAGSIAQAVVSARAVAPHGLKVEIEVRNLDEYHQAIQAGAEIVMLDNFSIADIETALKQKPTELCIEVSGGITVQNLGQYALKGINILSIGALTHSVQAHDFSLLMKELVE